MNRAHFVKLGVAVLLAGAAWADVPPPPERAKAPQVWFLDAAKRACWARAYDTAHMARHPKQKVPGIAFSYVPTQEIPGEAAPQPMWDQYSDVPAFSANVVVQLKGDARTLLGSAYCKAGGAKVLDCGIEGDGGSFKLTLQAGGGVRLDNPKGFSVMVATADVDAANDEYVLIDPKDDHGAFLMPAAKGGLCDATWPTQP